MATTSGFDRKRINGPEISVVPFPLENESEANNSKPLFDKSGARADGRKAEAVRPIFFATGVIPAADGSALAEQEKTKVICAVYGPRPDRKLSDPDQGRLSVDFRFAPFSQRQRRGFIKSAVEKEYSKLIHSALMPAIRLESFPKASMDVHIMVMEEDGVHAAIAAGISAASLALADAGIELYDLVTGSAAGFLSAHDDDMDDVTVTMDMTAQEESHAKGTLLLAYMSSRRQVTQMIQSGVIPSDAEERGVDYCIDAAAETHTLMTERLASAASAQLSAVAKGMGMMVVDSDDEA
ncbi:mRNA transport regulator 3 [Blastocladiella britannica]|nr:mRNA transport regulator 3 [Blastocladiella britannica]